jgi:hypothetical protein
MISPRAALWPADRKVLLIAGLGLALGLLYFVAIDLAAPAHSLGEQQNVISGAAGSPYRYRVLVPLLLDGLTRVFSSLGIRDGAYLYAWAVYDVLAVMAQLLGLFALARQWFRPGEALVGVAFISGVTLATFAYFTFQPWSLLEVTFFSLGFLFAYRGRWGRVATLVVLASLNRETGVFLPLALLLASIDARDWWHPDAIRRAAAQRETRLAFGLLLVSVAIFAGLRLLRGGAAPVDELGDVVSRNLERNNLIAAGLALLLFMGVGWIFALRGFGRAPVFIRRVGRVVPFYLAAFAIWGWWREVRILTTLYPILIVLVLAYCYLPRSGNSST